MHLKRLDVFVARVDRIKRLSTLNVGARKLFHTGALPGVVYGLEVTGASAATVRKVRGAAATLHGHGRSSRDIWGATFPDKDPLHRLVSPIVVRYAEEIWRLATQGQSNGRLLSMEEVKQAYAAARERERKGAAQVGPVGGMLESLCWGGWSCQNVFTLEDRAGNQFNLARVSPGEIKVRFRKDILAETVKRAEARMRETAGASEEEWSPVWWEAIRKYQKSKATALEKNLVFRMSSNTLLTKELWASWGAQEGDKCEICKVVDTGWHRATTCKRVQEPRCLNSCRLESVVWPVHRRSGAPTVWDPQNIPKPENVVRAFKGRVEVDPQEFRFRPERKGGSDGSATDLKTEFTARGAWAVVQQQEDGEWWWIGGTIPESEAQNAATGELMGAWQASEKGIQRELVVDCNTIALPGGKDVEEVLRPNNKHGKWWKAICRKGRPMYIKAKAHQEVPANPSSLEELEVVINDMADQKAKEANSWHRVGEQVASDWAAAIGRAVRYLTQLGERLAAFPKPSTETISFVKKPKVREWEPRVRYQHNWKWMHGNVWRCADCLRHKSSEQAAANFVSCVGFVGTMAEVKAHKDAHQLSVAQIDDGTRVVFFCRKCGAYSEARGRLLAGAICTPAKPQQQRNLRRLERGLHPDPHDDGMVSEVWDLRGQGTQHRSIREWMQSEEQRTQMQDGELAGSSSDHSLRS